MSDNDFEFTSSETYGMTDPGKRRPSNQDQFLIAEMTKSMLVSASSLADIKVGRIFGGLQGQILLVADGMGGHQGGKQASRIAAEHLIARLLNSVHWFFQSDGQQSEQDFITSLQELFKDAHERVLIEGRENRQHEGMGTTLTMAYVSWPNLYVVHAGDSRCYLMRNGEANQITTDHTLAHQLVEAGGLKPEEEASSRWSNVLWNVLGGQSERKLLAEVHKVALQPDDAILLCSDGLYRYLDQDELAARVEAEPDASIVCRSLIEHANDCGGDDNVTVVLCRPTPKKNSLPQDAPIETDPEWTPTCPQIPQPDLLKDVRR